ncbi:MAG: hypothetical protein FWH48_02935 [Oscillospiraceae bacterium]|nr:hypothetical protein [Oscillospiraceae bacterium]
MSIFKVNLSAINPKEEHRQTPLIESWVDTGSELSWMPKQVLADIGVFPRGKKRFATAAGQIVERDYGYAILSAEGYNTIDEVVFAEKGDLALLGVRTLEGFGVMVDNIGHRFVATMSIATTALSLMICRKPIQATGGLYLFR